MPVAYSRHPIEHQHFSFTILPPLRFPRPENGVILGDFIETGAGYVRFGPTWLYSCHRPLTHTAGANRRGGDGLAAEIRGPNGAVRRRIYVWPSGADRRACARRLRARRMLV